MYETRCMIFRCAVGIRNRQRPVQLLCRQAKRDYFATCHPGLEHALENELVTLGARETKKGSAGVSFNADRTTALRCNLWLRSAIRVLEGPIASGMIHQGRYHDEFYDFVRSSVDWPALLEPDHTFKVEARHHLSTDLTTNFMITRSKDAICDALRDARGMKPRPPQSGETPTLPLFITAFRDKISIFRNMSGRSLHQRGYRSIMHRASLNEAAAAAILYITKFLEAPTLLIDPMCGSGTFLIEAALMASNVAPGLVNADRRRWPFLSWPDFKEAGAQRMWESLLQEAHEVRKRSDQVSDAFEFVGNDIHKGALGLARRDADAAGVGDVIQFRHGACEDFRPTSLCSSPTTLSNKRRMVVTNPPWNKRLGGDESDSLEPWQELGRFLKRSEQELSAFVLSGNPDLTYGLGMRCEKNPRRNMSLGGHDCLLLKYRVYATTDR